MRGQPAASLVAARWLSLAWSLAGCATASNVVPVGVGHASLDVSYGGPLSDPKSTVMPLPMVAPRLAYGLSDQLDLTATLDASTLLFGLFSAEIGGKYFPVRAPEGWIPAVGVEMEVLLLDTIRPGPENRRPMAMPVAGATAAWRAGPGYAYAGFDAMADWYAFKYFAVAPAVTWEPLAGYRWDLRPDLYVAAEAKEFVADWRTDEVAADLYTLEPNGTLTTKHPQDGALGFLVSASWRFAW